MNLNLPNLLIFFRILLIPVFLVFFFIPGLRLVAMVAFIAASVTDYFDGYYARKWDMVTNFGKLMDPLADKMLVSSALIALAAQQELAAWVVVVIICREFWVTSLRMLALEQGLPIISASVWGKIKTTFQLTLIISLLAGLASGEDFGRLFVPFGAYVAVILVYLTVFATIYSAVEYTRDYRGVFKA